MFTTHHTYTPPAADVRLWAIRYIMPSGYVGVHHVMVRTAHAALESTRALTGAVAVAVVG